MKSPLVDVAAILICILAVVLIGQYYIHKKDKEMSLQQLDKRIELKEQSIPEFEAAVKHTE